MAHNYFGNWAEKFANYTSLWSMNPNALPAAVCRDSDDTRLTFSGGGYASCPELLHYCELGDESDKQQMAMRALVRKACPLTCGQCKLATRSAKAEECEDLP